ncbi:hypothetical protein OPV22_023392 [Ensete ventricosum]|uniref:Uncharacterized protein n=1 Tax=Ensete ventricosum TaxID=4639 RepID=A0AAV8QUK6_ENSVE|nr:hypothetical protein OPV22_023392 [Ensete ventricosum]
MHRAGGGQQRWGRWYSILRSEGEEQAGSRRPKDGNRASDAWRSGGWAGEEDVSGRAKKRRGLFVGVEAWESGGRWCGRPEDNGRGGVGGRAVANGWMAKEYGMDGDCPQGR